MSFYDRFKECQPVERTFPPDAPTPIDESVFLNINTSPMIEFGDRTTLKTPAQREQEYHKLMKDLAYPKDKTLFDKKGRYLKEEGVESLWDLVSQGGRKEAVFEYHEPTPELLAKRDEIFAGTEDLDSKYVQEIS